MCLICSDWEKEKLTVKEAMRNIGEILSGTTDPEKIEHLIDLSGRILDKDVPLRDSDVGMDANWEKERQEK